MRATTKDNDEQEKCLQIVGEKGGNISASQGRCSLCQRLRRTPVFKAGHAANPQLGMRWWCIRDKEVLSYLSPYRVTTKNILVGHHLKGVCMCSCVFKKARAKMSYTKRLWNGYSCTILKCPENSDFCLAGVRGTRLHRVLTSQLIHFLTVALVSSCALRTGIFMFSTAFGREAV